jgi:cytochrome c
MSCSPVTDLARLTVALLACLPLAARGQPAGDAARGAALFVEARCSACHLPGQAASGRGPDLRGLAGRPVFAVAGYADYAPGLSGDRRVWSTATLDAYLADPRGFVPAAHKSRGVADAQQRADLVAYLLSLAP